MHYATRGRRGAWIATFVLNAFIWLVMPVGWAAFYCTGDRSARAGSLPNIADWLNLIFGLLAAVALMLQLTPRKAAS